jgi:hypothetical protein
VDCHPTAIPDISSAQHALSSPFQAGFFDDLLKGLSTTAPEVAPVNATIAKSLKKHLP